MRTVVIGGGISGLSLGFALQQAGRDVRVLEAGPRAGGSVRTIEKDGFLLECGPHGFLDLEPAMQDLIETLGLAGELRAADDAAKRRYLVLGGALRALPGSPPAFLKSDLLPWSSKLRVLLEPFSRRGKKDDESLADFARRHVGAHATSLLIDAAQTGIYAGDVERLSARATFPKMVAMEEQHRSLIVGMFKGRKERAARRGTGRLTSFRNGLSTLTDALAARLGPALSVDTRIQALEHAGGRWRLTLGTGEAIDTERLVLAIPAHAAAPLLAPISPPLAEALSEIRYAPLSVVHLAYRNDALGRPLDGFGMLAPASEQRRFLGCIWVSAIYPERTREGHALLTVMIGGARHPALAGRPPDELVALAHEELSALLGASAPPVMSNVVQWPRALPQYEVGHAARLQRIDALVAGLPGLTLTGNAYRGIGLNDCVRTSKQLSHAGE